MVHEEHNENLRELLDELIEAGDVGGAMSLLLNRHPADQADLIAELEEAHQELVIRALPPQELAGVLEFLSDDLRRRLLAAVPAEVLAPIIDRLDDAVAADVVQDLAAEQAQQVVALLAERASVEELLAYPEESAGGRMTPDVVVLQRQWTVGEAVDFLRREHPSADQPFYLYVVDEGRRLIGVVSLRSLVTSTLDTPLAAIMSESVISVRATEDQEVAAERMRHYNLLALPVVDEGGRLLGVITPDAVLDVQVEEATEDMFHLAGLPDEERIFRPVREAVPPRLGWLLINLCTAFVAASTVNFFEGTIEQVAALAVFMPMVAGMGGNAGIQTITLVVRSIALGEITTADAARVIEHEAVIALIKGVVIGLLVGVIAWAWKGSGWLGLIVGFALLANILNATLIGVLVPMALKRLKADPALASGVFVTMLSDAVGLLVFLGLATLLVSQLT